MSYKLRFHEQALKEWKKLGTTLQEQFKKKLAERLEQPRIPSEKPGFFIFKGENHESESVQGIGLPRSGAARCRTGLHGDADREGCQQDTQ